MAKEQNTTKKTRLLAETALMTALLVVLQWVTKPLGQAVTGSCVNFVLGVSALVGGFICGAAVALLSPFFAFLLGIGPAFLPIVPMVAIGNLALVTVLWYLCKGKTLRRAAAVAAAALLKFALLYLLVVKVAVPTLGLPEAKAAVIAASFSWLQLVTALIGGSLAALIAPTVLKTRKV